MHSVEGPSIRGVCGGKANVSEKTIVSVQVPPAILLISVTVYVPALS